MAKGYHSQNISSDKDLTSKNFNAKIGIVWARFNHKITNELKEGALRSLKKAGVHESQVVIMDVPGAVEIPVMAKAMIETGCDAVIALGAVIRGETTHYEFVCNSVERGCTHLALETGKPVVCGVLTVENEGQAMDRIGGSHGHKGEECGEVAIEMILKLRVLKHGE